MNTFHKVLFVLAVLIANCISASAIEFTVNGVRYSVNDDNTTVTVAGYPSGSKPTGDLTIPESVTYGDISYPVTSINDRAFSYCRGLTSVTIPNSVTSIGDFAFSECSGLTSVTIGNSVTSIGDNAFYECSGLTSIKVESGNSVYDSRENCNAIIETATNTLIRGCKNTIIPNSVTSIGDFAFCDCSGLTSITIPNSVTSIGDGAFLGCSGLKSIKVESGNSVYDSRENCNAIIETVTNTLIRGCKNTIILNSVTSIGTYAFWYCSGLTSVTIPNSVTSIGYAAFSGCSGLTSVTIPNSVTEIGNWAFSECSGLTRIDAYPNPEKVSIGANAFYGVPKDGTLHVLPKYLSAYQTASEWCDFTNIKGDLTEIGDINLDGNMDVTDVTTLMNMILNGETANLELADINADGKVNVSDVAALINIVLS